VGLCAQRQYQEGCFLVFHCVVLAVSNSGKNMHVTHACASGA
jgi:hypothetical protein